MWRPRPTPACCRDRKTVRQTSSAFRVLKRASIMEFPKQFPLPLIEMATPASRSIQSGSAQLEPVTGVSGPRAGTLEGGSHSPAGLPGSPPVRRSLTSR